MIVRVEVHQVCAECLNLVPGIIHKSPNHSAVEEACAVDSGGGVVDPCPTDSLQEKQPRARWWRAEPQLKIFVSTSMLNFISSSRIIFIAQLSIRSVLSSPLIKK
jgi:hypothetical protein